MGYSGDTWSGEVTAFDNDHRMLTLTYGKGEKASTFVASIPDAPYQWCRDARNFRVVDFPYDKKAQYQTFKYDGPGFAATILPGGPGSGMQKRPNPPASNVITDLAEFMGRPIIVYYSTQERTADGKKEKYNDVWRIRRIAAKTT